jgi:2,5-dihydroxypyridine 5,6-dioxygenase
MSLKKNMISNTNIKKLVHECGQLKDFESVIIVYDLKTSSIAHEIFSYIKKTNTKTALMEGSIRMHGAEPSKNVSDAMFQADLIFGMTSYSMAHTFARKKATDNGARYLSLPDYNLEVINSKAFQADFIEIDKLCCKVCNLLKGKKYISVKTSSGTDLTMNIEGRQWNNASGILLNKGILGSPPDSEINIAPNEYKTKGVIVVDGSIPIPKIGLLDEPEILKVSDGVVTLEDGRFSALLNGLFADNPKNRIVGEFGIGFNPFAKLCGRMLEDEGSLNTCHFGVGSNSTIGGINSAESHIDFVIKDPIISSDSKVLFQNGTWNL